MIMRMFSLFAMEFAEMDEQIEKLRQLRDSFQEFNCSVGDSKESINGK